MTLKKSTLIIAVLFVVVVLGTVFYYLKHRAQTDQWQTYKDSQFGFEIQYPSTMKATSGGKDGFYFYDFSFPYPSIRPLTDLPHSENFEIKVLKALQPIKNCNERPYFNRDTKSTTTINNVVYFTNDDSGEYGGMGSAATSYCTIRNGIAYILVPRLEYFIDSKNKFSQTDVANNLTLKEILDSFKFAN